MAQLITVASMHTWPNYAASVASKSLTSTHVPTNIKPSDEYNRKISLLTGSSITSLKVDALVTSTDSALMKAYADSGPVSRRLGTVDGAVHDAAGPDLRKACARQPNRKTGQVIITDAYNLPAKKVIHSIGPVHQNENLLSSSYANILTLARMEGLRTVAIPCIATGINGYPVMEATHVALQTIRRWMETGDNSQNVDRIVLCVYQQQDVPVYQELLYKFFPLDPFSDDPDDKHVYDMSLAPGCRFVGKCLIINIVNYKVDTLPTRTGSEKDAERIKATFGRFGFHVEEMRDVKKDQIFGHFEHLARTMDTKFRCFVCFVLAHGLEGDFVVDVDEQLIDMEELTKKVDGHNCVRLAGKPKLFFAQMCRGMDQEEFEQNRHLYDGAITLNAARKRDPPTISPEQDKMIAFSTSRSKMSRRYLDGSEYITELCNVLDKYGARWDLSKVMRTVRRKITELDPDNTGNILCPEERNTLTKDLHFTLHYPNGGPN